MKTKFLCLVLGVIMMLAVLTGCSDGEKNLDDIANEAVRETQTLVVYLMSEKEVSEQTAADIEEAINRLTKAKFKTQLDLRFFTEDEYYTELEKKFKDKEKEIKKAERAAAELKKKEKELRESCKAAGISYIPVTTPKKETVITEAQTLVNQDYGTIEYVYPEAGENQLDFFYLGGYDRYIRYSENEWLAPLDEELTTASKKLEEHIPGIYMNHLNKGGIYGVPNNSIVDEYSWMLLDKELMDNYLWTENSINNFTDENLMRFLSDVVSFTDVTPVAGKPTVSNVYYWTVSAEENRLTNQPSIIGSLYSNESPLGYILNLDSIFHDGAYRNQVTAIKRLEYAGYINEEIAPFSERTAVTFVRGGYDIYSENAYDAEKNPDGKYYVKMLESPRADVDDVFEHMFSVNMLEDNVARSMEIITYINTNEEIRNILQYGVEDENYYIDDNGVLHRYNDSYMMDVNKTGNIFMAHPEEGCPANYWENGVKQNADAMIVPTYGMDFGYDQVMDSEAITRLQNLYPEYIKRMNECTSLEELNAFFKTAQEEIEANADYKFIMRTNYVPKDEDDPMPIYTFYWAWLLEKGYRVEI